MTDKIIAGQVFKTNKYGDCRVVKFNGCNDVEIEFIGTGYKASVEAAKLRRGLIKDYLFPIVCGKGYFGIGEYKATDKGKITKEYQAWHGMFLRCYHKSRAITQPTYAGCTVHSDWHNFQTFAKWHEENYIEGCHLDKDLIKKGNKIYSPKTCVFITRELNNLMNDNGSSRMFMPIGVQRRGNRYTSRINIAGKSTYLGTFDDKESAHRSWKTSKSKEIIRQAMLLTTPAILVDPLLRLSDSL